jgi:hypothetical protein
MWEKFQILPGRPDFHSRPDRVTCSFAMRHFHEPAGLNDFDDPATWDAASYSAHPIDSIEPLSDEPNPYREAALHHLGLIYSIDEYLTEAKDARFAAIVVAIVLGWPSTRGLTVPEIAGQLGVSVLTISRACAGFREMAGLDASGRLRPGARSLNGDKPAVIAG